MAKALLEALGPPVHLLSSVRAAELTKLVENIYRSVNIALVNEMAVMSERMGLDIWEVIDAAATKPFGYMPFRPGPGVGGHCIPVDPLYLAWKAREYRAPTRFIDLAAETNESMPEHVVSMVEDELKTAGTEVAGSKILLLGMAFKANVEDTRNSPAAEVLKALVGKGARVSYHDPYVPSYDIAGSNLGGKSVSMASVSLDQATLSSQDCVVILVKHDLVDYRHVLTHAGLVVDAVNASAGLDNAENARVLGKGTSEQSTASRA